MKIFPIPSATAAVRFWLCLAATLIATSTGARAERPAEAAIDSPGPADPDDDGPIRAVTAWIEPGGPGRPDVVHVAVLVHEDWWVHSLHQRGGDTAGKRTRIVVAADSPRRITAAFAPLTPPAGFLQADLPEFAGVIFERHFGLVTWAAPLVPQGPLEVRGTITVQADSEFACSMPETHAFVARPLDGHR